MYSFRRYGKLWGKHDKGNGIPMKIWNETHHLTDTNLILNETFTEDAFSSILKRPASLPPIPRST